MKKKTRKEKKNQQELEEHTTNKFIQYEWNRDGSVAIIAITRYFTSFLVCDINKKKKRERRERIIAFICTHFPTIPITSHKWNACAEHWNYYKWWELCDEFLIRYLSSTSRAHWLLIRFLCSGRRIHNLNQVQNSANVSHWSNENAQNRNLFT